MFSFKFQTMYEFTIYVYDLGVSFKVKFKVQHSKLMLKFKI